MKIKQYLGVFFICLLFLVACQPWQPEDHAVPPTKTQIASEVSPSVTSTVIPAPTLAETESADFLVQLVSDNHGCELPCIWGLVVGQTDFEQAKSFLETFAGQGGIYNGVYENSKDLSDFSLGIGISLFPPRNKLEKIYLSIYGDEFVEKVGYFNLSNILDTLGQPTDVSVSLSIQKGINEPEEAPYELLFFYQEKNVLIKINGIAVKAGTFYQLCPLNPYSQSSFENHKRGNIDMFIGMPASNETASELVQPFWILPTNYKDGLKVFNTTVEEFYNQLVSSNSINCFLSSSSSWN